MHYPIQKGQLSVLHGTKMGILPNKQMDTQLQTYLDSVFNINTSFLGRQLTWVCDQYRRQWYLFARNLQPQPHPPIVQHTVSRRKHSEYRRVVSHS